MSTITSNTKKCYECCINRLKQEDIFPLIQKHPKLVINWINSSSSKTNSLSTQNSFISAILWYLRTEWPTTDLQERYDIITPSSTPSSSSVDSEESEHSLDFLA